MEKISFKVSPDKKFTRPHLNRKSWAQWGAPIIPATPESEIQRIVVLGQPRQKSSQDHISTGKTGQGGMCLSSQLL
jgi:hypothetical protein